MMEIDIAFAEAAGVWLASFQWDRTHPISHKIVIQKRWSNPFSNYFIYLTMPPKFSLDERIEQLRQFKAKNGHLIVPRSLKENGLGKYVDNMRRNRSSGTIKPDIKGKLDAIGFVWVAPKGSEKDELIAWGKLFNKLVQFHESKGHCKVPPTIAGQINPLFEWCQEQRRLHLSDKLVKERMDQLLQLGFDLFGSDDDVDEPVSSILIESRLLINAKMSHLLISRRLF